MENICCVLQGVEVGVDVGVGCIQQGQYVGWAESLPRANWNENEQVFVLFC